MGFGLVFGDLGKVQEIGPLPWTGLLAGSSDNSMTRQLNYYLKHKKNGMRLKLMGKEVTVTYISQDRRRLLGHVCGLGNTHIFLFF